MARPGDETEEAALANRAAAWRCLAVTTRRRERPLHPIRNFRCGSISRIDLSGVDCSA
jgi:hypothetical protein